MELFAGLEEQDYFAYRIELDQLNKKSTTPDVFGDWLLLILW